jgi:RHS repeat-associated protein
MSAATLNGVTQATFAYDAYGQRIVKTNPLIGAETHYIYDDAGQLLAEMDGVTGEPIREYIWLGKVPIGYVDRLGAGGASRLFFIHDDHLGRSEKFTDSSGNIAWDGVFLPFGEIHSITGTIDNVLRFPGQIYDRETDLTQNWHRYYDPRIGRFIQSDPNGIPSGINTYRVCTCRHRVRTPSLRAVPAMARHRNRQIPSGTLRSRLLARVYGVMELCIP